MYNKNYILKTLCAVMMLVGLAMFIPIAFSMYYGENDALRALLACAVPMSIIGFSVQRFIPDSSKPLRTRDGLIIVAVAWLSMSTLGALPFMIHGCIPAFPDAFFETASGFTTTGASILTDIEALPKGMLMWRSLTHWLGGMGILVLTIALFPTMGIGGQRVMRAETTGPTMDKVSFTLRESAGSLYKIYIAFTIIELVLLMFGGMSLYDSLIHTSGTMGTGGFSNYAASVGHFNSVYIDIVISVFMLACGVNFGLYHRIFYGKKLSALKDPELRFYLATVGVSTIFIAVVLTAKGFNGFGESLRQAFFQVSSIITTTGFATADFNVWPLCTKILLIALMLMGSCASSTGGGLKVVRIILIIKMIRRGISRRIHPNSVEPIKLGDKTLQETTIQATAAFVFLYLAITMFCIFAVSFENIDFETCISSVVACISNIGPGFGMVGPTGNYAFFSPFSKILLALAMIAGRLELYAIVLPLSPRFWNSGR